jgi:hypothetical protein
MTGKYERILGAQSLAGKIRFLKDLGRKYPDRNKLASARDDGRVRRHRQGWMSPALWRLVRAPSLVSPFFGETRGTHKGLAGGI